MTTAKKMDYFPDILDGIHLGMTLKEFEKAKNVASMQIDLNDYVSYINENVEDKKINHIVYQFDRNKELYEVMLDFKLEFDLHKYMLDRFGKPNHDQEWLLESSDNYRYKIWRFGNRLCIANADYFE